MARFTDTCFNIIVKNSTSDATTGCVGAAIAAQSLSEVAAVLASSYIPQAAVTEEWVRSRKNVAQGRVALCGRGLYISILLSAQSNWGAASSVA